MGADAPLSSFVWVTINGEDWGLYIAAEGVEESFAQRVYGNGFGEIYKPDSMVMGDMRRSMNGEGNFPGGGQMPNFGGENGEMPRMPDFGDGAMPNFGGEMPQMPRAANGQGERTRASRSEAQYGRRLRRFRGRSDIPRLF